MHNSEELKEDVKVSSMTEDDAKKHVRDGEELVGHGFVKRDGFDKSMVFLRCFADGLVKMASRHQSFRMELVYDAETLNTDYYFFAPSKDGSQCKTSECKEG